ncbi:50S ribosomal protein L30 [Chloroflexota bacterium]
MANIRVTWVKSGIGYSEDQKRTLKALGLRRLNQSVIHKDGASIRGMVNKVRHLLKVAEAIDETE